MKQKEIDELHHEIRNPLAIISLIVHKMLRTSGECDTARDIVKIGDAVKRIDAYLKQLKSDERKDAELLADFESMIGKEL